MLLSARISLFGLWLLLFAMPGRAQVTDGTETTPTISARSTLVLVPALVRNKKSGELVFTLKVDDFVLTDDGVPQKLKLEEDTGGEPLALVVMIEAGGDGVRMLGKYEALPAMLENVIGAVPHKVAVVAFDSRPELEQDFTEDIDKAADVIPQLAQAGSGDNGAAILDALSFSIDLLRKQPIEYRRAVLMVTETLDRGSKTKLNEALKAVSDTNTAIYAIGFSSAITDSKHQATSVTGGDAPRPGGCFAMSADETAKERTNQIYDCLGTLAPPLALVKALAIAIFEGFQKNVPETVAKVTGGEYFKLGNQKTLERDLTTISNHIPNRYILSFQPQSPHPGFHAISLKVPGYVGLAVSARNAYWVDSAGTAP